MTLKGLISTEGKVNMEKIIRILALGSLAVVLVVGGHLACKKAAEEAVEEEDLSATKEGIVEFDGKIKVAVGKYIFIPKVRGFDIVVQGALDVGDSQELVGQQVRGDGEFSPENPSILAAKTLEIKEAEGVWRNVFTRTEDVVLDDYLGLRARDELGVLKDITYDKKQGWEGKEKVKIYGRLEKETVTAGEEEKIIYKIIVLDDKEKEIGRILVDRFTDFALYYVKKLRLFDKFWFYITVKETVDWSVRRRTRELFHADVLYAGLF